MVKSSNYNLLGYQWFKNNDYIFPTPRQVLFGILEEHLEQLRQKTKLSKNPETSKELKEAHENVCDIWNTMWKIAQIQQNDTPIHPSTLHDPSANITQLILYIFSLETFVYKVVVEATRNKDMSKAKTLGPFARVLSEIILKSACNRLDT